MRKSVKRGDKEIEMMEEWEGERRGQKEGEEG